MSRFTSVAALALALSLLAPATSLAGGFATAGLSSLPRDVRPGDEWVVDVTVLQHGVTPLQGVTPHVRIALESAPNAPTHAFAARPTREPGVYRARVEFPSRGFWAISVHDGFTGVHDFGGVDIGEERTALAASTKFRPMEAQAPPAPPRGPSSEAGSGIDLGLALGLAALACLLVTAVAAARGLRPGGSPARG
jgi:hypothetical protein